MRNQKAVGRRQKKNAMSNSTSQIVTPLMIQDAPGYNSWPFIQIFKGGLVCTYSRGREHRIDEPCRGVFARCSWDGGRTWGGENVVVNTADACECAEAIGVDSDGALIQWVRCYGENYENCHHDFYRSVDGLHFERLATVDCEPMPMQIMNPVLLPDGTLQSLWFHGYDKEQPTNSWGTFSSKDHGHTWTRRMIEDNLPIEELPTEPSAVYLGNGMMLAIARNDDWETPSSNRQFQLQSTDSGQTWAKFKTNITDVLLSTPGVVYDAATGLVSNYYYERNQGWLKRRVMPLEKCWDHPLDWPAPQIVSQGSKVFADAGNVNVTSDGSTHYCSFYTGQAPQTNIVFAPVPAPAKT